MTEKSLGVNGTVDPAKPNDADPLTTLELEFTSALNTRVAGEAPPPDLFDEDTYLDAFPDVLSAIRRGDVVSASEHFLRFGAVEHRLDTARYRAAVATVDTPGFPAFGVDAMFLTQSGNCLVIGWVDDTFAPLEQLSVSIGKDLLGRATAFARCRRLDAELIIKPPPGTLLGFWTLLTVKHLRPGLTEMSVSLAVGRSRKTVPVQAQPVTDQHLHEMCLEYLASAGYWGDLQIDGAKQLDCGLGDALLELNIRISKSIVEQGVYIQRFGPPRARFDASIVVCLYGKPEFLFLQASLFSSYKDWDGYEFIYVVNSPEIAEQLLKEAALATRIYGVSITLVLLPGNAGFGVANNIAVEHALSNRILICNPDVFPRSGSGRLHAELVAGRPAHETRIFGAPLFYDDGSLMHGGMFFESDVGVSIGRGGVLPRSLVRVEHYGKGAPPDTEAFLRARPVPAITGAFMSFDRKWFERLDGFSPKYMFGHYEDADLCLRSLTKGQNAWLQPIPLWHLEGKGSVRRLAHEGASLVNRWHFTRTWGDLIAFDMNGREARGLVRLSRPDLKQLDDAGWESTLPYRSSRADEAAEHSLRPTLVGPQGSKR